VTDDGGLAVRVARDFVVDFMKVGDFEEAGLVRLDRRVQIEAF
jgi:hypothetical protein